MTGPRERPPMPQPEDLGGLTETPENDRPGQAYPFARVSPTSWGYSVEGYRSNLCGPAPVQWWPTLGMARRAAARLVRREQRRAERKKRATRVIW